MRYDIRLTDKGLRKNVYSADATAPSSDDLINQALAAKVAEDQIAAKQKQNLPMYIAIGAGGLLIIGLLIWTLTGNSASPNNG